jgi:drug/metabolite transporter (DMT)-like permease
MINLYCFLILLYNKILLGDFMFILAIITLLFWAFADLFYKKGNDNPDPNSHLKTGMSVGIIMGIHATLFLLFTKTPISLHDIIVYLPVSFCYITSMVIGYKGLKYIELSISSPIQNSSGAITSLLLFLIFKISLSGLEIAGVITLFVGVLALSLLEVYYDKENRHALIKKMTIQAVFFPIIYALFDGLGTFLDSVYLDQMNIISSDTALIAYEYSFLIYATIVYLYLKYKKHEKNIIKGTKSEWIAAVLETLGQFTYVYAIADNSVITIPIIACYSSVSVLLAYYFLKEKLTVYQHLAIIVIMIGIAILAIADGA